MRPVIEVSTVADTTRDEKRLPDGLILAILYSECTPLGECVVDKGV